MTTTSNTTMYLLCCTANMGNAAPTDLAAWIPAGGCRRRNEQEAADDDNGQDLFYDIIAIGMQEATWKTKKDKKGQIVASVEEEEEEDSEQDSEEDAVVIKPQASDLSKASSNHSATSPKNSATASTSSNDTVMLREMLLQHVGEEYKLLKEYQRGQMRLYLFVRHAWVPEIKDLDVKAENTGIGHVYHNKGGILVQFMVRQTRLTIATAHLAAHEGTAPYKARNDSVREILRGARPHPKHLASYDAATVSHHMWVMGDLNYRIRMPPGNNNNNGGGNTNGEENAQSAQVQRALALVQAGDFQTLYQHDELQMALQKKEVLCQFQTLPCHFSPTFKMLRQEGFHYKTQRIPSYTDRILFTSAEHLADKLKPLEYEPCPGFATSDHKPIRGAFAIELNGTSPTTQTKDDSQDQGMTDPVSLTFRDMKCKDLPPMDVDGSADPYVMFACDPIDLVKDNRPPKEQKQQASYKWPRTSYLQKTLNPVWNEQVKLCIPSVPASRMNGAMLLITIMDYDLHSSDDFMATLALNLSHLVALPEGEESKTILIDRLLLKYGKEQGKIQCTIDVQRGGIEHADQQVKKKGFLSKVSKRLTPSHH